MIFHKYKCIFIHIPKCAGTSITNFFAPDIRLSTREPNYDIHYGWCPKRRIHLQHATVKQIIETELISKEIWESYFKFTFVRNPWDRAYSDYLWMLKELKVNDSFMNFLLKKNRFANSLLNDNNIAYRGDHLLNQTDFFYFEDDFKLDFVGRFENLSSDMSYVLKKIGINSSFNIHNNKSSNRYDHYSKFYNKSRFKLVNDMYKKDIELLNYNFVDMKSSFDKCKLFLKDF